MTATSAEQRVARIDEAIAGHRRLYLKAIFKGSLDADEHEWQVDRLLDLRNRVIRKATLLTKVAT